MNKIIMIALASLSLFSATAIAKPVDQEAAIKAALNRHIVAFNSKDVAGIAADYDDDAVVVIAEQVYHGKPAAVRFFQTFFQASDNILQTDASKFDLKIGMIDKDIGTLKWVINRGTPKALTGEDVLVFRKGKIVFQAVVKFGPYKGD